MPSSHFDSMSDLGCTFCGLKCFSIKRRKRRNNNLRFFICQSTSPSQFSLAGKMELFLALRRSKVLFWLLCRTRSGGLGTEVGTTSVDNELGSLADQLKLGSLWRMDCSIRRSLL